MIQAAENAAERLRADFARADGVTVTEKGPADFVSSADLASQEILQRELGDAFPDHELAARVVERCEVGLACSSAPSCCSLNRVR